MSIEEMRKKEVDWLIKRFEGDIVNDCHGYTARFERSDARKELNRRRKKVLSPIVKYLKANPPSDFMQLNIAWAHLLNWTEVHVDPDKTGPQSLEDTDGWIKWAEKFAA